MKNIGVRLPDDLIHKLENRSTVTGEDKATICRNAIALALGEPVPPSPDERFQDIIDRLSRLESLVKSLMLQKCPAENALEGGSNSSQVCLDVPNSLYSLSEWVNSESLILCPHCGSVDSDWAEDDPGEGAPLRTIVCHQCRTKSTFDMNK